MNTAEMKGAPLEVPASWGAMKGSAVVALTPHEAASLNRLLAAHPTAYKPFADVMQTETMTGGYYVTKLNEAGECFAMIEMAFSLVPSSDATPYLHLVRDAYRRAMSRRIKLAKRAKHPLGVSAWVAALETALASGVPMWWSSRKAGKPPMRLEGVLMDASGRILVESASSLVSTVSAYVEWADLQIFSLLATQKRSREIIEDARKGNVRSDLVEEAFDFLPMADVAADDSDKGRVYVVREQHRAAQLVEVEAIMRRVPSGIVNGDLRRAMRWVDVAFHGNVIGGGYAWGRNGC